MQNYLWTHILSSMKKLILAIETSCDETSIALVEATGTIKEPKFKIVENLVASQIKIHRPFGGVVPNLAKREHIKNLPILYKKLSAKYYPLKPDLIAVTAGPGLEPALWAGIEFAKILGKELKIPVLGANHLEGHLYSFLLAKSYILNPKPFPAIGLIVSGGHTTLLLLKDLKTRKKLGETRDDAVGEAFDKVARILELPYPGGPEVEKIAKKGKVSIEFPRPMIHQKNYDFSFSGLKTSVLYYLRDNPEANKANIAASFQKAAIDVLTTKTMRAIKEYGAKSVLLSGGVAANKALRKELEKNAKKIGAKLLVADFAYNTDNAVMIAVGAYINLLGKKKYPLIAKGDMNV